MVLNRTGGDELPPFYIGTGGTHPGVYLVQEGQDLDQVAAMQAGQSVYSMCQSPDGTRLIAGTRDRNRNDQFGQVNIWERRQDGTLSDEPILSCFQPSSVTSVAMATSTVGLSGGLDGVLRCWHVSEPHQTVAEVQAHEGPILATHSLSSQIGVTAGADGLTKVWDLDRLEVAQAFSDLGSGAPQGFLSIEASENTGQVVSLYPSGTVLVHDLRKEDVKTQSVPVPNEGTGAMTLAGDRLVLADQNSPRLRVLPVSGDLENSRLRDATCPSRVHSLEAISVRRVLVVYNDGSSSIWKVGDGEITEERSLDLETARSAAGPPRRFQLAEGWKKRSTQRSEMLNQVRENLDTRDISDMRPDLQALVEEGMEVEAMVLLADWARQNDKPIRELKTRLRLVEHLPEEPWCAVHNYALGALLERLNESDKARSYYEAAERCQTGYRDARSRAKKIQAKESIPPGSLREEWIDASSRYILEVKKHALLNQPWTHHIVVKREEENLKINNPPSLEDIHSFIDGSGWSVQDHTVVSSESSRKSISVLTRRGKDRKEFSYGAAIEHEGEHAHLIHRFWVSSPVEENGNSGQIDPVQETRTFAKEVKKHIERVKGESTRTRRNSIKDVVRDGVEQAFQLSQQKERDTYF